MPSNNLRATSMIGEVHEPLATLHSRALGSKLVMPSYMQIGLCPTRGMRGNSERNKFYCIVVCRASCKTRPIMRHYPTTCYPHNDFCLFCMCVRMYVCTYMYKYTHACVHLFMHVCVPARDEYLCAHMCTSCIHVVLVFACNSHYKAFCAIMWTYTVCICTRISIFTSMPTCMYAGTYTCKC